MNRIVLILAFLLIAGYAQAQTNCGTATNNLTNGTTADATQVMGDFSWAQACSGLIGVKVFATGGTYTPDPGTAEIIVEVVGAGGGGAGAAASTSTTSSVGAGGSAGGYFKGLVTAGFSGATVTVGAGGAGGSGTTAAGAGGASGFVLSGGVSISCTGGGGTTGGAAAASGWGGGAYTGQCTVSAPSNTLTSILNVKGQAGSSSVWTSTIGLGGTGGNTLIGLGGPQVAMYRAYQIGGYNATGYGAGGGGAISFLESSGGAAQTGGSGAPGVVIVWEFSNVPPPT